MQLGIGKTVFPAWSAASTLVKAHGVSAGGHAADAIRAGDGATRLDSAVRAMTSFDHAVDNTRKLPVQWFVGSAPLYFRGYEAAKQAVNLLVSSGLIPGAKERVGRQSLIAARDTFLQGVGVARIDSSRFGRHLANGWLEATAEDALAGAMLLNPANGVGRDLLAGINLVRIAVDRRQQLDLALVQRVSDLFDRAGAQLTGAIDAAVQPAVTDPTAFQRSGELLAEVQHAAHTLVEHAPADSVFEQLPTAG